MILYLDASSLVKLYIDEPHSSLVHGWVRTARVAATSRVAYPETLSALARRQRAGDLDAEGLRRTTAAFREQWSDFDHRELNETMAGALAIKHGLRALDAIHLAAAVELRHEAGGPVDFTVFDVKLARAAEAEGLRVLAA